LTSSSSSPEAAFAGRVALVTGGSGGIGVAICRQLASEGAKVAVGYGSSGEAASGLAAELGGRAFGADLADPAGPERLVRSVEAELGRLDVLVVNHGYGSVGTIEEVDAAEFDRAMAINLRAPFLLARAALGGMRERGYGRILFIGSVAALRGGVVGPHYASSKAGLHGLTHFLASRTAGDGVTVNTLAPGFIDTPMLPGDPAELGRSVPVGRVGTPEEVADLAVAMLRNGYLTSHVFSLDGGSFPR
jgi:3-oxoacyl-[acyl-carrier protein] reductase